MTFFYFPKINLDLSDSTLQAHLFSGSVIDIIIMTDSRIVSVSAYNLSDSTAYIIIVIIFTSVHCETDLTDPAFHIHLF